MSTPSEFLAKGGQRVIARNFQVGLGLGEGLGFKIAKGRMIGKKRGTTLDFTMKVIIPGNLESKRATARPVRSEVKSEVETNYASFDFHFRVLFFDFHHFRPIVLLLLLY